MDPLSEVLSLLKPQSYVSGGFEVDGDIAVRFPKHSGIKCYAIVSGEGWLVVECGMDPVRLTKGDCFLLPRGFPFRLTTDLALTPMDYMEVRATRGWWKERSSSEEEGQGAGRPYIVGGHFLLTGRHAEMLLRSLPPVVHIRSEGDKAAMRWSLERMKEELREQRPGSSLIAQQMAYVMLVQALRLHLADGASEAGWLRGLADTQMSAAIACMHEEPGRAWTLEKLAGRVGMSRSIFAQRFKETVGATPMEYLARWRMLLAGERLRSSGESIASIASSLGYESESAFGKAFRRVMGASPRRYSREGERVSTPA
jgi:AraC-like DNA-binding protein